MMGLDAVKICAAALLAALCFAVVRKVNAGFDMPLRLTAAVTFFGVVIAISIPLFGYLSELVDKSGLGAWQSVIFGAVGISLLTHVTAELCRECGEGELGGYAELAGKVEILLLCLPLIKELLAEVEELVV